MVGQSQVLDVVVTIAAIVLILIGRVMYDIPFPEEWLSVVLGLLLGLGLAVMRELIKARGRPLSRVELLEVAWGGADLETTERAVDNVILRLRRKLPRPDALETVRGVGYRVRETPMGPVSG